MGIHSVARLLVCVKKKEALLFFFCFDIVLFVLFEVGEVKSLFLT